MPESLRRKLHRIRERHDDLCWDIADRVAELNTWQLANEINGTISDVCFTIKIELDIDLSEFTIYNYYLVGSKLNTEAKRQKFGSVLPFSHLLWARQFTEDNETVTFLEVLNMDMALMDENYGNPVSKDILIEKVTGIKRKGAGSADHAQSFDAFIPSASASQYDGLVEAAQYIERTLPQIKPDNASDAVLIGRAITAISKGVTLLREWLEKRSEVMVQSAQAD